MSFLVELWDFMRVRKKFWLLPILIVMLAFGGFMLALSRWGAKHGS